MAFVRLGSTPRYTCVAADVKTVAGIETGATAYETDTGDMYIFDGAAWVAKVDHVQLTGSSVAVTATQTRPNNVTAYTALDVVGTDPAANMTFATGLATGTGFVIFGARLRIDAAAIPAGMTSFRLHLYTSAPTAIADNAAFGLIAGDRAKYLGYVEISGVLGLGATLWAEVDNINFTGKLAEASSTLYGVLQTVGAYTPTASVVKTVSIIIAPL